MSEWWTYRLSDFLLFSPRTYYRLFELYNAEVWPGQLVALLAGLVILGLLRNPGPWQSRIVAALLAACWLWVAWAYHYSRYASINWAAAGECPVSLFGGEVATAAHDSAAVSAP